VRLDQRCLDGRNPLRRDGLLAVELVLGGSRDVVFDVGMSTGRSTVDAGSQNWSCRNTGSKDESKGSAKIHADLYLLISLYGLSGLSLWQRTKFDKKK
jgi:hypothetical protein